MQEKGASGQTIIKALVQNSASYQGKTEFSKVKYLKKKAKKYQYPFSEQCLLFSIA